MNMNKYVCLAFVFLFSSAIASSQVIVNDANFKVKLYAEFDGAGTLPFGEGTFGNSLYSGYPYSVLKVPSNAPASTFTQNLNDSVGGLTFGPDSNGETKLYLLSAESGPGGDDIIEIDQNGNITNVISNVDIGAIGVSFTRDHVGSFSSSGSFFVGSSLSKNILKVDPSGNVSNLTVPGSLKYPMGMALGYDDPGNPFGNDSLFVADLLNAPGTPVPQGTNTIVKVSPIGEIETFASGVDDPFALAFGTNNIFGQSLFVGSRGIGGLPGDGSIFKVNDNGDSNAFATGFNLPLALAFNDDGKSLFVGDLVSANDYKIYEIVNVVPEPSTLLLIGIGLVGVISIGRKRMHR